MNGIDGTDINQGHSLSLKYDILVPNLLKLVRAGEAGQQLNEMEFKTSSLC